jgi:hypothetical protein
MTRDELTPERIRDILCVPEPTDDIEDIDFDEEDFDMEAEKKFIEDSVNDCLEGENA